MVACRLECRCGAVQTHNVGTSATQHLFNALTIKCSHVLPSGFFVVVGPREQVTGVVTLNWFQFYTNLTWEPITTLCYLRIITLGHQHSAV